ncbi:hypothetical protein E8E11_004410 [Didymella keratinophila]|nr:hypothetical protein E8E11_004410 [Didymella keratinophila]
MPVPFNLAQEQQAPPTKSFHKDGVVLVEVGEDRKKYFIHEDLLACHSEYFAAALKGSWREAREKKFLLEDVSVDACTF